MFVFCRCQQLSEAIGRQQSRGTPGKIFKGTRHHFFPHRFQENGKVGVRGSGGGVPSGVEPDVTLLISSCFYPVSSRVSVFLLKSPPSSLTLGTVAQPFK